MQLNGDKCEVPGNSPQIEAGEKQDKQQLCRKSLAV